MFFPKNKIQFLCLVALSVFLLCGDAYASSEYPTALSKTRDIPILLYHHIADLPSNASGPQKRWTLSPKEFQAHMEWIVAQGFHPISMAQLVSHFKSGEPLPPKPIVLTFDDGWKDHYFEVFPILKKLKFTATFFINTDLIGHSAYANWDQLKEMSEARMDIEPHSHTHQRLTTLSSEEAWKEIVESKRILESHLKKRAIVFSYPYGSYNAKIISLVKEAGFEAATTVNEVNNGYLFRKDKSYTLSRYPIKGDDTVEKIAGLPVLAVQTKHNEPAPSALFVSLIQNPPVLTSHKEIKKLISFAQEARISTLFVQIYRANKAWFPSKFADTAPYEKCVKMMSLDPFTLLIAEAHRVGIKVHAWLNLLSLADNKDAVFIKKYGTEVLTRNINEKNEIKDFKIDKQYFLEPGDLRVRQDLSAIVEEIVLAYPQLDGIQFDYIRYPDTNPHYGYTNNNIERFKKNNGFETIDENSKEWKDWKRSQVTELLSELVKKVRSLQPDMQVSATGCMSYARAYHEAYQDWPSWLSQGIVDFVTIMSYSAKPEEFSHWLTEVKAIVPDFFKVKIGIGAYKFLDSPGMFEKAFSTCQETGNTCAIFHYGSIENNPELKKVLISRKKKKKQ